MVATQDILLRVPDLLAELSGLSPTRRADMNGEACLVLQLGDRVLVIEPKSSSGAGVIASAAQHVAGAARRFGPDAVPILAVPFMGEVGRRVCSDAGVGFIDLSGNAHIMAPPLVVHVEGRPNRFIRRGRPSSVFAPKSSRVARLLLLEPTRWWKQHELAREGSLGAGFVSRICKRLVAEGLVERDSENALRSSNPALLLDAWRSHYDFESHGVKRGHVSARNGEELTERLASLLERSGVRYALTGLAAAWRLAPFATYRLVTLYVENGARERLLEPLDWRPEERGANVWLVRPNDAGVFHGAAVVNGANCVSPVQAYLDLRDMPERSDEAADRLREERLRWR